jgi:hypothetical protein
MKSHQSRPVVEELEELLQIAVREHGPQSRSSKQIGEALQQARSASERPSRARGDKVAAEAKPGRE